MTDFTSTHRRASVARVVSLTIALLVIACVAEAAPATASRPGTRDDAPAGPPGTRISGVEQHLVDLVNRERAAVGAPALTVNYSLMAAAWAHNEYMVATGCFSHEQCGDGTVADRLRAAGYRWTGFGENIGADRYSAEEMMAGWMGSTGHRANILHTMFTDIGVAYSPGSASVGPRWTQVFGRPEEGYPTVIPPSGSSSSGSRVVHLPISLRRASGTFGGRPAPWNPPGPSTATPAPPAPAARIETDTGLRWDEQTGQLEQPGSWFPYGVTELNFVVRWFDLAVGTPIRWAWYLNDQDLGVGDTVSTTDANGHDGQTIRNYSNGQVVPLPRGMYVVRLWVERIGTGDAPWSDTQVIIGDSSSPATPTPYLESGNCGENSDVTIEVRPAVLRAGRRVEIAAKGESPDSCIPSFDSYQMTGNLIRFYAKDYPAEICHSTITNWEVTTRLASLPAGDYTAQFLILFRPGQAGGCAVKRFTVSP